MTLLHAIVAPPPGSGSFRLRENSIKVQLRQKGTSSFFTRTMPQATTPGASSTIADVDGVSARDPFGTQFDGY
jgi:hypothetical protein